MRVFAKNNWRASALAMLAGSALTPVLASAQVAEMEKARTEVNLTENLAKQAVYACQRQQYVVCAEKARLAGNAASRALYAVDKALVAIKPPVVPPVPPVTTYPKVGDVPAVASGLNIPSLLGPVGIPGTAAPDVVGAFRFLCGPGQVNNDDPIVYPGQPGAAHLHQYFGNLSANANSTYASLRKSGESTCQNALNRSAYWMPAMLDGKGNVVRPDFVSIYYKRRPKSDPTCNTEAKGCVGIPRGLRFVFGWDQTRPTVAQPENAAHTNFMCVDGWTPFTAPSKDMVEPAKVCKPGQRLYASLSSPECWNGTDLDSKDHRSHLADRVRDNNSGKLFCPATHPKLIPQFTMTAAYSIEVGDNPTIWGLASDPMIPAAIRRPGASFHSDYFEAWEDIIRDRWEAACIDKLLNCSDGNLGDGSILARGPHYPQPKANPRLVPIPAHTAH